MDRAGLSELIEGSDLNGLVRFVDGLSTSRDWDGLFELRDRCREALERGKQLAGVAEYAEYRAALDAPGAYSARAVAESAALWTLGPLWEVAASTHTWGELDPHLPEIPARAFAAHERVVRGEDLREATVDRSIVDLPLILQPWEPAYAVATYRPDKADFPAPLAPALGAVELPAPAGTRLDPDVDDAFHELTRIWSDQSNGRCRTTAVEGTALRALAALGVERPLVAPVPASWALQYLAWAGASGGAHGRRRGSPVGRLNTWWVVAALAGLDWPPDPQELGETVDTVRWTVWEPSGPSSGWSLRLACELDESAWAVDATDEL